jgi:hypothetical protein
MIGSASRAVLADLDGDRDRELVIVDASQLRVLEPASGRALASLAIASVIQVLVAGDVDGDGRAEVYAGWGATREHRDAKARISVVRLQGTQLVEDTIVEPVTSRPEVAAIVPMPDQQAVLVAYFASQFMVDSAIARHTDNGWRLDPLASIRMATSYARGDVDGDGKPDLVVGRMYGDDKGIDGDAFVLARDGTRTKLPTTRGLRSLAVSGGDVFGGDGWHQNYGRDARGLLTRIHHGPGGFTAQLVENTPGQYALERILPATIDGRPALVTLGSHYVRVFVRESQTWRGLTIAGAARDVAVEDVDGRPGDEIVIVGDKSELVDLAGVRWP